MTYAQLGRLASELRCTPLEIILPALAAVRDCTDKDRWQTPLGSISVTGSQFFNWNRQTGGGGAIDLVMHLRQINFKEATLWLRDRVDAGHLPAPQTRAASSPAFQRPTRDDHQLPKVIRYLTIERGLPQELLAPLVTQGEAYADRRGNAVFLVLNREGSAVGAELRGTTSVKWRGMAAGSRKMAGFFSVQGPTSEEIILCESAIDALSAHALIPRAKCISTAGAASNPLWLNALLARDIPIYCGFDNDVAGDQAAEQLISRYPQVRRLAPEHHDWNDDLLAK